MELPFDVKNIIFDYLGDTKDKINFCHLDKENNNRLKIKKLIYPDTQFTRLFLRQKIFSELEELDISNNSNIYSVNYLKNLKKLICKGQNSNLRQWGIKNLKLRELYCDENMYIYDVGHMKGTLIRLEPNDNITKCRYNDVFCCFYRLGVLYLAVLFFVLFIIFASVWFGIYFGLISREVYINTQYIKTIAIVDNITVAPYTCCNLICNTCAHCDSMSMPPCNILTGNKTIGDCCGGPKCCRTCYKQCCYQQIGKIQQTCHSCNPYCCYGTDNSKCYNNCGTCHVVNVYYNYNISYNKTIDTINNYNCGMDDVECIKNIYNNHNSNFTIYYDKNNILANTRTIGYTPEKFAGLGIISICLIIVTLTLAILSVKYVHMLLKYKKFIRTRKEMDNILLGQFSFNNYRF